MELETEEFAVGYAQSCASSVAKVGWEQRFRRVPRPGASSEFSNVIVAGTYRMAGLVWESRQPRRSRFEKNEKPNQIQRQGIQYRSVWHLLEKSNVEVDKDESHVA